MYIYIYIMIYITIYMYLTIYTVLILLVTKKDTEEKQQIHVCNNNKHK